MSATCVTQPPFERWLCRRRRRRGVHGKLESIWRRFASFPDSATASARLGSDFSHFLIVTFGTIRRLDKRMLIAIGDLRCFPATVLRPKKRVAEQRSNSEFVTLAVSLKSFLQARTYLPFCQFVLPDPQPGETVIALKGRQRRQF